MMNRKIQGRDRQMVVRPDMARPPRLETSSASAIETKAAAGARNTEIRVA
jgi:hypothetical protein